MGLETRLKRETWNRFKDSMIKKGFEERWFCDGMKCIDIGPDCVAGEKMDAWIGKRIEDIKTAEECEEISRDRRYKNRGGMRGDFQAVRARNGKTGI